MLLQNLRRSGVGCGMGDPREGGVPIIQDFTAGCLGISWRVQCVCVPAIDPFPIYSNTLF